jgi:hypothetical protein
MSGLLVSLVTLLCLASELVFSPLVASCNELLDEAALLGRVVLVALLEFLEVGYALLRGHGGELRVDGVTVV